jgi:hypothetical protein
LNRTPLVLCVVPTLNAAFEASVWLVHDPSRPLVSFLTPQPAGWPSSVARHSQGSKLFIEAVISGSPTSRVRQYSLLLEEMMVLWSDLSIPDADSVRLMRLHEQPYVLRTDFVLPIGRHALTLLVADYANKDRVRDTRANIFVVVEPIGASRGADADLHISVGGKTVECARAVGEAPDRRESRGGGRVELACVSDAGRQYTLVEGSSRSEMVGVLNQSVTAMIADMGLADQAHVAPSLALLVGSLLRDSAEPTFSVGASTEHWAVVAWAASDPSAYLAPLLCAVWEGLGYRVLAVLVGDEWGTDAALSAASAGIGALKTVTVARVSSAEVAAARVTAETFAQVRIHRRPRMRAQARDPSSCLFFGLSRPPRAPSAASAAVCCRNVGARRCRSAVRRNHSPRAERQAPAPQRVSPCSKGRCCASRAALARAC